MVLGATLPYWLNRSSVLFKGLASPFQWAEKGGLATTASNLFSRCCGEGNYTKEGNQNALRDEDVERIVKTYRNREAIDKYSYVATLEEIAENDHNLNIPRYVDTFEEEEAVDLDVVSEELKDLEAELDNTNQTIADFCSELNIPTPF